MKPPVVLATRNRHKVRELRQLLRGVSARFVSLRAFPAVAAVRENGGSFDANAARKARAAARATGCLAIADDSGLEVQALGWRPGIRSARFAGPRATDAQNNRKLLRLLRGVPLPRRGARYRCSLAAAAPDGRVWLTRGIWQGRVALAPRGRSGFGYDPLFEVPRCGKTVAQLGAAVKARLSHRGHAARKMQRILVKVLKSVRGI